MFKRLSVFLHLKYKPTTHLSVPLPLGALLPSYWLSLPWLPWNIVSFFVCTVASFLLFAFQLDLCLRPLQIWCSLQICVHQSLHYVWRISVGRCYRASSRAEWMNYIGQCNICPLSWLKLTFPVFSVEVLCLMWCRPTSHQAEQLNSLSYTDLSPRSLLIFWILILMFEINMNCRKLHCCVTSKLSDGYNKAHTA